MEENPRHTNIMIRTTKVSQVSWNTSQHESFCPDRDSNQCSKLLSGSNSRTSNTWHWQQAPFCHFDLCLMYISFLTLKIYLVSIVLNLDIVFILATLLAICFSAFLFELHIYQSQAFINHRHCFEVWLLPNETDEFLDDSQSLKCSIFYNSM